MASHAILSNYFEHVEEQWTQNLPQYLSGLSRALFPTTFLEIAVYNIWKAFGPWEKTNFKAVCGLGTKK